ncbi:MAG TPA: flippase [Chitinophagaceae bacterium]|nr:flippase [Chitinophagaceae bacterium]
MRNLKPNFIYQLSISFLQAVVPIITFPYVSRILGPEAIGKINFIDYIAQFLLVVSAFGIPMYAAREVARLRGNKVAIRKLVSEIVSIHIFTTLICLVIFAIAVYFSPAGLQNKGLIVLALINLTANAFSADWLIQGLEDFAFISKRTVVIRLVIVSLMFLLVTKQSHFTLYYSLLILGSILIVATDIYYAYKKNLFQVSFENPFRHLKPLAIFFFTTSAITIYSYLDTFVLGVVAGSLAVGLYTTALKTVKLSQNFVNDLSGVLLPRISYLYEQNEQQEIARLLNKSLLYVVTVSIPLSVFFFVMAPEIVAVIAGPQYTLSITTLRILAPLPLIMGLSNIFGIQVLIPFKKEKIMLWAVSAGSVVSIVICLILCPGYKQEGAAWACVIAEAFVTFILFIQASRYTKFKLPLRQWMPVLLCASLFIPIIEFLRSAFYSNLISLFISIVLCGLLYVGLQLVVFSNVIVKEAVYFFAGMINLVKK